MTENRERIYIVGFRNVSDYLNFEFPDPIELTKTIKDVADFNNKVEERFYYTQGKYANNLYEKLVDAMDDDNTTYQWRRKYVRKNQSNVIPTLTANMGEGGHNVPLIKTKKGIRKLTPKECFNAQGYPESFELPKEMADSKLYKQAGNSVSVTVIERIADNIAKACEQTNSKGIECISCSQVVPSNLGYKYCPFCGAVLKHGCQMTPFIMASVYFRVVKRQKKKTKSLV